MNTDIVSPKIHSIVDYALGTMQMGLPTLLGLPKSAQNVYRVLGAGVTALNMATATPAGVKNYVSVKGHKIADIALLGGLALLSFFKPFRENKKARIFHLSFLGIAALQFFLTDYNSSATSNGR